MLKLDLTFNNGKPKDWHFVLDLVTFRTGLGYESTCSLEYSFMVKSWRVVLAHVILVSPQVL